MGWVGARSATKWMRDRNTIAGSAADTTALSAITPDGTEGETAVMCVRNGLIRIAGIALAALIVRNGWIGRITVRGQTSWRGMSGQSAAMVVGVAEGATDLRTGRPTC